MLFCRSQPNIGTVIKDDIRRAHPHLPLFDGPHTRDVQKASRSLASALLQEHGARGAMVGMRAKTHDDHPANNRVR